MKVSLSWLKELVSITCDVDDIAESLSMSGFEVEEVVDLSSSIKGLVIGYIQKIEDHPNANKLKICTVDVGKAESLQIVCGASNVREGINVLVATEGAYLKAIELKIKSNKIRGINSQGMICSLSEIGMESTSNGIAVLDDIYNEIPAVGKNPADLLGLNDVILDLAITANRPDGMSMVGIAREVSAIKKANLTLPKLETNNDEYILFASNLFAKKAINKEGIYSIHYIENIDGSLEAPNFIRNRLKNSGINSINLIVDVINYVMLEQGQPMHAFDADLLDKITNKKVSEKDFGIRLAHEGETFLGVDAKKYVLTSKTHLVTCSDIPIAIAGVLGSSNSSVNNKTKRIWLESALFAPGAVRNSVRDIGKRTDASSRYEKGISSNMTILSANRVISLLIEYCNCYVKYRFIDKKNIAIENEIILRRSKINSLLGKINVKGNKNNLRYLTEDEIKEPLLLLGCNVKEYTDGWLVKPPLNRTNDLYREIDFIEEIARLVGYDKFDSNLPQPISPGILNPIQKTERNIRKNLCSIGFQEVNCSSLVPENKETDGCISISNPLLKETSTLRTNMWEEHIKITKRNIATGQNSCWIFEIGKIYSLKEDKIQEETVLSGLIVGKKCLGKWHDNLRDSNIEYFEARGLLETAFNSLFLNIIDHKEVHNQLYHPGKSAILSLEGKQFGRFGQLHPAKAEEENINYNLFLFEFDFERIQKASTRKNKLIKRFKQYPTVPYMERDISIIIEQEITYDTIRHLILKEGKSLVECVDLLDIYNGSNLEQNKKSLTCRIRYRKEKDTLKEEDINPVHDKILKRLNEIYDAKLRH